MKSCSNCGKELKTGAKFCGFCGSKAEIDQSSASSETFRLYVLGVQSDGCRVADVIDQLMEAAADIGISTSVAIKIIEECAASENQQFEEGIIFSYDSDQAQSGVAGGNTVLVLKITNNLGKNIKIVKINLVHPETGSIIPLPELSGLLKGREKLVETDLIFERPGRQSIRDGIIGLTFLDGSEANYVFAAPIRLLVESVHGLKANITSLSQTIQTNGGGVISAGGLTDNSGRGKTGIDIWAKISVTPVKVETAYNWFVRFRGQDSETIEETRPPGRYDEPNVAPTQSASSRADFDTEIITDFGRYAREKLTQGFGLGRRVVDALGEATENSTGASLGRDLSARVSVALPFDEGLGAVQLPGDQSDASQDKSPGRASGENQRDESALGRKKHILEFFDTLCLMSLDVNGPESATIFSVSHDIASQFSDRISEFLGDDCVLAVGTTALRNFNSEGQFSGFEGRANVVGTKGIYHFVGENGTRYRFDGRDHFAPWMKLFRDFSMGIRIDAERPGIWIGKDNVLLIDGSYIDYSNFIDLWIHFRKYKCLDLFDSYRKMVKTITET